MMIYLLVMSKGLSQFTNNNNHFDITYECGEYGELSFKSNLVNYWKMIRRLTTIFCSLT